MSEEKYQINVGEGTQELVVRHGDALPLETPKGVHISGQIGSPVEFANKRMPDDNNTHVTVNREKGIITLTCNESFPGESRDIITGSIQFHPHFTDLQIDSGKWSDPAELGELLRRRRRYFANSDDGLKLVSALKHFTAKVDKQLEKVEDKGARRYRNAVEKVIESNLPQEITLNMPVLKGFDYNEFKVEIVLDVRDGGISIWLESPELEQLKEGLINTAIEEQLDHLKEYVIIEL